VKNLHLVVRDEGLEASMSQYLIERIGMLPNVELHTHTEVVALEGDEANGLTGATLRDRRTRGREHLPAPPFVSVHWRRSECQTSRGSRSSRRHGFVVTGANLIDGAEAGRRQALPLETSWPGVFAIGDVRAGSTSASPLRSARAPPSWPRFTAYWRRIER